jgi:bifunctional non-homologous end joining protein LigD
MHMRESTFDAAGEAGRSRATNSATAKRAEGGRGAVTVAGVALSNPDKPYFPEAGLTKRDIAEYYEAVSARVLPHVTGRPLSLVRCPDGWSGQCFYQRNADLAVNAAVQRIEVPERNGTATYMGARTAKALVALVQWGVVEIHPWGARGRRLDRPDRLIFDFDPDPELEWKAIAAAVILLHDLLSELGLESFLKTTGGKGLHVIVPVRPTLGWDDAKGFCRAVAELMVTTFPDRFIATMSKRKREGRIFVDYLRNWQGATAIAPYAVRARRSAPVSTPLDWHELGRDVRFDCFNVKTISKRLTPGHDPWAAFATAARQSVTKAAAARVGFALGGRAGIRQ